MSEAPSTGLDVTLDRKTVLGRAQHIIAGVLNVPLQSIKIVGARRAKDGYHRVKFQNLGPSMLGAHEGLERTAVLDLSFPIELRPISELIQHYKHEEPRELFLGIGAGLRDYPKKEDMDPKESQRAFFATDVAYGVAPVEENYEVLGLPQSQRYRMPSKILRSPWPPATHFFSALNYADIPNDTFDVIQMANVLTDPQLPRTPLEQALRVLKPDTGEFAILNEFGPLKFSPHHLALMASAYGGIIDEIVFYAKKGETKEMYENGTSVISKDIVSRLKQNYHLSPEHLINGLPEGAYCVIVKKSDKPGVVFERAPDDEDDSRSS